MLSLPCRGSVLYPFPRCCPLYAGGLPALDPQRCPLHPGSQCLHILLYSPIPGRVCPRALPLVLWCANGMGWKIWLEPRDAGVRTGRAGLGVLEQGRTPGKSLSGWKGVAAGGGGRAWGLPHLLSARRTCPEPPGSCPLPSPHTLTLSNPTEILHHGVLRDLLAVPMGVSGAQISQTHAPSPQTLCPLPQRVPGAPMELHREE